MSFRRLIRNLRVDADARRNKLIVDAIDELRDSPRATIEISARVSEDDDSMPEEIVIDAPWTLEGGGGRQGFSGYTLSEVLHVAAEYKRWHTP